jgi:hypothetical protein
MLKNSVSKTTQYKIILAFGLVVFELISFGYLIYDFVKNPSAI